MSLSAAAVVPGAGRPVPRRDPLAVPAAGVQREMAHRLAVVAEYRDDESGAHAARVAAMSGAIADGLALPADSARLIELAAPLHDLGKVAIPDAILLKEGPLTPDERTLMEQHTTIGAQMLEGSDMPVLQVAREIALSHHERWDGLGYPRRLSGPRIPLPGRIVAIADVFDALMSQRPYKPAWALADALAEIRMLRGAHFDPAITDAFLELDHRALLRVIAPAQPA
jgi:putative two-component system response regulator